MNTVTSPLNVRRWILTIGSVALVGLLIASPFTWNDLYIQNVLILMMILAIMASTWNIMGGFTGYISLGHSAYLGIGAYTTAIIAVNLGWVWWAAILTSAVTSAALAGLFGLATRWARGHAFVMVTFAALELLKLVVMNLTELTNGNYGIIVPVVPTTRETQQWPYYFGTLVLLVLTVLLVIAIRRSKFGAGLLSIREDEDKAASVGIPTSRYKVIAFMLAGIPVGLAGGLYAYYIGFTEPRGMFAIAASMQIVLAVLLGGRGTIAGPLLGAAIVEPLSQVTTALVGGVDGGAWRLVIFGGFLLAVILLLPQGIIPAVTDLVRKWRGRTAVAPTGRRFDLEERAPAAEALAVLETSRAKRGSDDSPDILVIDGLRKRFGGVVALDDCSFNVPRGSVTALIGPNGSGKTTAFNAIDGSITPDGGRVLLNGEPLDGLPRWERAYRGLGRTYQSTRLFPALTVRENLVAPLREFRWGRLAAPAMSGEERDRAEAAISLVGLGRYLDLRAGELSYGQQKLVELAQILVLDPELVMLDEPASGINPKVIDQMGEMIVALRDAGKSVLIVEHNMPFVLGCSDLVHVLAAGRRIATGTPDEIRANPAVLEAYLGDAETTAEAVR
jgi:ABC-type branched-subunit amino acid transport system ATPase component/ABC-type branched-subunit amino acid transport system permease subunit